MNAPIRTARLAPASDRRAALAEQVHQYRHELWRSILAFRPLQARVLPWIRESISLEADAEGAKSLAALEADRALRGRRGRRGLAQAEALALKLADRMHLLDADDELVVAIVAAIEALMHGGEGGKRLQARAGRLPGGELAFAALHQEVHAIALRLRWSKQRMAEANQGLVVLLAKRYAHEAIDFVDLVQEGNLGLIKAIDRFDPGRGHRFSTYATWWIRHFMTRYIYNHAATVRVPVHVHERQRSVARAERQLVAQGLSPSPEAVADSIELSVDKVRETIRVRGYRSASLSAPAHAGANFTLEDSLRDEDASDPAEQLGALDLDAALERARDCLDAVEYDIVQRRFGLDGRDEETLRSVGASHGLSRERIRQIQSRALDKMRAQLGDHQEFGMQASA